MSSAKLSMRYINSPYRDIPEDLINDYTLNGQITIKYGKFFNDVVSSSKENSEDTRWDHDAKWDNLLKKYSQIIGDEEREKNTPYGAERAFTRVREAMEFAEIYSKKIAIIGSLHPWIEALGLHMNCSITTVEYNLPKCSHPDIEVIYWDEFVESSNIYDAVISFSSIEHSGLGRYGDPLNPNGDIETVSVIKSKLNPGSPFLIGVPCGKKDRLVWNAHRVYGPIRFPMLTKGFKEIKRFERGQPVIVLKKI